MAILIPNCGSPLRPSRIEDILEAMTRTPTQILGEPPLSALPLCPFRPPCTSYEAALAIMRNFVDPITLLGESPPSQRRPASKHAAEEARERPPTFRRKARRGRGSERRRTTHVRSPVPFSELKDSRKSSDKLKLKRSAAEYSDSKKSDGRKPKLSPAARAGMKDSKRKGDRQKSHKSALRESESKDSASRSAKKLPSSVPLPRPVVRIPCSEPAAPRSTTPNSRKSWEKERRNEHSVSRRKESSVERSRRDDAELSRRRRESSVEVASSRSEPRDTEKLRSGIDGDGFCNGDEAVSGQAEKKRGAGGEIDHALLPDHKRELPKRKEKERRQAQDPQNSVVRDSDLDNEALRDKGRGRGRKKSAKAIATVRAKNIVIGTLSKSPSENLRHRGLKRVPDRNDEFENERERKSKRKEQGQNSEMAQRLSKERKDTLHSKSHHQLPPRGPFAFRSEPADKVLARNTHDSKNGHRSDGSPSDIEKQKMKETTPRKPMLRSVPASAIVESRGGESKSSEVAGAVFHNTTGSASPGESNMIWRYICREAKRICGWVSNGDQHISGYQR
ncbi:unnamed protein product [Agarophyton chilense]